MSKLAITLKRSTIGCKPNQIKTAKALGLTKTNKTVVLSDTPVIRGMVNTIAHLVEVKEVE